MLLLVDFQFRFRRGVKSREFYAKRWCLRFAGHKILFDTWLHTSLPLSLAEKSTFNRLIFGFVFHFGFVSLLCLLLFSLVIVDKL